MIFCRVTGDVVSTVKNPKFEGHKLLLIQPVELDGKTPVGSSYMALDRAQAGVGDLVLVLNEGSGVRLMYGDDRIPLSAVVMAVVDDLDVTDPAELAGTSALELTRAQAAEDEA